MTGRRQSGKCHWPEDYWYIIIREADGRVHELDDDPCATEKYAVMMATELSKRAGVLSVRIKNIHRQRTFAKGRELHGRG